MAAFPPGASFKLTTIFRQAERGLQLLLSDLRAGVLSAEGRQVLHDVQRPVSPPHGIKPLQLFATNSSADAVNSRELLRLPGPTRTLFALDDGPQHVLNSLIKACPAPCTLDLRVGAQVGPTIILPITHVALSCSLLQHHTYAD